MRREGSLITKWNQLENFYFALKDLRNGRVLERMKNMRERVELKKETDKEKMIREEKIKAKKRLQEKEERKLKEKKNVRKVSKSKVRK